MLAAKELIQAEKPAAYLTESARDMRFAPGSCCRVPARRGELSTSSPTWWPPRVRGHQGKIAAGCGSGDPIRALEVPHAAIAARNIGPTLQKLQSSKLLSIIISGLPSRPSDADPNRQISRRVTVEE